MMGPLKDITVGCMKAGKRVRKRVLTGRKRSGRGGTGGGGRGHDDVTY